MARDVAIDIAKGIGIILVVIGHFRPDFSPGWYDATIRVIYTFHMPLFIFASGYLYALTGFDRGNYGGFLVRKVKRLLVPYLTASVLIITIKYFTEGAMYVENPVTPYAYLRMFWYPEAGYFLWFVWAIWWMFVVTPLFRSPALRLVLLGISLVLYFLPWAMPEIFCIRQFCQMYLFFMLGVVVAEHARFKEFMERFPLWLWALAFVALETLYLCLGGQWLALPMAVSGIFFTLSLSRILVADTKGWGRWILTVSACSYIIYLFHTTFEGFTKSVAMKFIALPMPDLMFVGMAIVVIATGIVGPILLQRFAIEKSRILRFLFGL